MEKMKAQVIVYAKHQNKKHLLLLQTSGERNHIWQNVTGSVDSGESFFEGAKRELLEETGIVATPIETKIEYKFFDRWQKNVIEKVFYVNLENLPQVILSEEHENYKWIPIEEIRQEHFHYSSNYEAFCLTKDLP